MSKMVLCGFAAAWFFAASPTRRSSSVKATYDGVMRLPVVENKTSDRGHVLLCYSESRAVAGLVESYLDH